MSTAYRVYLLHPDQQIYRVPAVTLTQLCAWSSELKLPEFANQRIPFAHVYVQMQDRVPMHVKKIEGQYVRFEHDGSIDTKSLIDAELVTMRAMVRESNTQESLGSNVIDARDRFEMARCLWTPNTSVREQLVEIALMRSHARVFSVTKRAKTA